MSTMLLVVGMQNDKQCGQYTCVTTLQRINKCIQEAKQRGWMVVFALELHHPQHISFQTQAPHCVLQSWGACMVKGLDYGFPGSDLVVRGLDKDGDSNDAFFVSKSPYETPSHLRGLLTDKRLCLCGYSPDGCIEQTALTASTYGYCNGDPIIIRDCCSLETLPQDERILLKTLSEVLAMWG